MTIEITEKWARTAAAGAELDRVVAGWMGGSYGFELVQTDFTIKRRLGDPKKFSTDWSAAGPLLEAMRALPRLVRIEAKHVLYDVLAERTGRESILDLTPIDIARSCAVLVARGITREDLEDK